MKLPNKLAVKQQVELIEVFSNFETKNRYRILDESGKDLFYAYEESNFFARHFLKRNRPLKVIIIDSNQKPQLTLERSFFFFRPHYIVKQNEKTIGHIKKNSWWHSFRINILDENENLVFECNSHIKHPWTYKILKDKQEVGVISKKWSESGKEIFTDSDNFHLDTTSDNKELLLATIFAIDTIRFEKK